jgi:hypothetical protein
LERHRSNFSGFGNIRQDYKTMNGLFRPFQMIFDLTFKMAIISGNNCLGMAGITIQFATMGIIRGMIG